MIIVCLNWLRKIVSIVKMNIQNDIIAILSKEMKINFDEHEETKNS
jgi:hypothetical protein